MDLRRVRDWTLLTGARVEIRQQGTPACRQRQSWGTVVG